MRSLLPLLLLSTSALAAEPVCITLLPKPTGNDKVVTLGQAAKLTGGSAAAREKMAKLDLMDRKDAEGLSRKLVRFRLNLAGYDDAEFTFDDLPTPNGALLSAEAVEEAAKQELIRRLGVSPDEVYVDVVKPVVVKLPVTTARDAVELSAVPVSGAVKLGRTQMDVTIKVNGERKLTLAVFLQASAVLQAKAEKADKPTEVVIRAKQRVTMTAKVGELKVTAAGIALQDAKIGQSIRVENMDSKKVVTATVTGPNAVEIDLGEGN